MFVKEMHIEVNQSTQKIAANRTRKLLDEEVDWLLNKNQQRLIQSRVTPRKDGSGGFEIKQFDIDAIRALLVTGREVSAYVADPRRTKALLPGDYAHLISDESVIKRADVDLAGNCVKPTSTTLQTNLLLLPLPLSPLGTGPYYGSVQVYINGGLVFDIQQFTQSRNTTYIGYDSKAEVFFLQHCILRELADAGWRIYWERYGERFYPKTFIIDLGPAAGTGSVIIDGQTFNGQSATYSMQVLDYYQQPAEDQSNRLTGSHIIQNLREVAFYKTQPESPISELAGGMLYTYTNKTFIVISNRFTYIRKARNISLTLGQDCELPPEYHQMICDLTVEYFKAMIADPNWEVKLKDNMTRTPI